MVTPRSWQSETARLGNADPDDPTGWFERLWASAREGDVTTPWDHDDPHPALASWTAPDALGPDGLIDDDVALTTPWGFDLGDLTSPVLVAQGGRDRVIPPSHARWLVDHLPAGELWLRPRDGHVAVLDALTVALDWLLDRVDR